MPQDEVTVTLSREAYRMLCGLVQPNNVVDTETVKGSLRAWNEIRRLFPLEDYDVVSTA